MSVERPSDSGIQSCFKVLLVSTFVPLHRDFDYNIPRFNYRSLSRRVLGFEHGPLRRSGKLETTERFREGE